MYKSIIKRAAGFYGGWLTGLCVGFILGCFYAGLVYGKCGL